MNDIELKEVIIMSNVKIPPTKEDLEYLYILQGFSTLEIGEMYNYSDSYIGRLLKKYNIKIRSLSEARLLKSARRNTPPTKKELEYLYYKQGFTIEEICDLYGRSGHYIYDLLNEYKIKIRSIYESKMISFARKGKILPCKEDLDYLYSFQGFSIDEIGDLYNFSPTTINKLAKYHNIYLRSKSEALLVLNARNQRIILPNKEDLNILYTIKGLSQQYIGYIYQCGESTIKNLLNLYDIDIRVSYDYTRYHIKNKEIYNSKKLFNQYLSDFNLKNDRYPFINELALNFNVDDTTIRLKIHEFKLEERTMMYSNTSKFQTRIEDWLKNHNIEFEKEFSLNEGGKRFDIKIKDKNILIEANPSNTHAIIPNAEYNSVKGDKNYHKNKTLLANKHGYRLIHIYDWTIDNLDDILSFLLPHKRYYARETEYIHELEVRNFIKQNHRHHTCMKKQGCALKDKKTGEILAAMTFKKFTRRKSDPPIIETHLEKFCIKRGVLVIGGFSKLLKNWIKHEGFTGSMITFCDMDLNSSLGYQKLGFKIVDWGRNYYYGNIDGEWVWRRTVQKHLIPKHFPEAVGNTEKELMASVGYYPIFTAGITRLELFVDEDGLVL